MDENSLISKSRPLLNMRNSGYTLGEFKLLDLYLARINPLNPETSRVTLSKKEYCAIMEIESGKVREEQLKKYTAHFLGNVVTLDRPDGKKGYIQKNLFTTAEYDEEEEKIVLDCNSDPLIFNTFFNVENIGYVRYILKNTLNLKSVYSYKLFTLVKSKTPAREFQISLPELRQKLGATTRRYESFKYFNRDVLSLAVEEINQHTDTFLSFEKIKKSGLTREIRFFVSKNEPPKIFEDEQPQAIPTEPTFLDVDYGSKLMNLLADACEREFSPEQMDELFVLIKNMTLVDNIFLDDLDLARFDYLEKKYKELNVRSARTDLKPVSSRFGYLKSLINLDLA